MKPSTKDIVLQLRRARPEQSALKFWAEEFAALIAFVSVLVVWFVLIALVVA